MNDSIPGWRGGVWGMFALVSLTLTESLAAQVLFAPPAFLVPGHAVVVVATGDLDGDQQVDIVVAGLDGQVSVYRNRGRAEFEQLGPFATDALAIDLELADLDGDSFLDLAAVTFGSDVVTLLGRGDGSLGRPVRHAATGVAASRALAA